MNRKFISYASLLIIVVFIGYIVYDSVKPVKSTVEESSSVLDNMNIEDAWDVAGQIEVKEGKLNAVTVSQDGKIYAAGNSFVTCYGEGSELLWSYKYESPLTALAVYGDTVFASSIDHILVISGGKLLNEWGPFEANSIITSVSAAKSRVAFSDAGNKKVYILDKGGEVVAMAGQNEPQFVLPSAYFDVTINADNTFWVANTGHRRIEKRTSAGALDGFFGEAGLAPEAFCGCCNPSHFAVIPGGFITAEKGINRIKILDNKGDFVEFVSSKNDFEPSVPLDVASADGKTIYAANPADSKIYVFKRKI
ncbi:MAG: hypothetical protein ACM3UT_13400 [Chloroflexota bacterium]